jgi:hypothetical protein
MSLTTLPHGGLAVKMQNSQDIDFLRFCDEVHTIWEAVYESPANFELQPWKLQGTPCDSLEDQVEFIKESSAQARLLLLVPEGCSLDVEVRLRTDDYTARHPLSAIKQLLLDLPADFVP